MCPQKIDRPSQPQKAPGRAGFAAPPPQTDMPLNPDMPTAPSDAPTLNNPDKQSGALDHQADSQAPAMQAE